MKHYGIVDDSEEHECVWGPLERSTFAGTVHRKCTVAGCRVINALDDDEDDWDEGSPNLRDPEVLETLYDDNPEYKRGYDDGVQDREMEREYVQPIPEVNDTGAYAEGYRDGYYQSTVHPPLCECGDCERSYGPND